LPLIQSCTHCGLEHVAVSDDSNIDVDIKSTPSFAVVCTTYGLPKNICEPSSFEYHGIHAHTFGATHIERCGHARSQIALVQSCPVQPDAH
jgi:hypothetical protein